MLFNPEENFGIIDPKNCLHWEIKQHYIIGTKNNSWIVYLPNFLSQIDANTYFDYFHPNQPYISWQTETIKIFGKSIVVPRWVAWYGDKAYGYSGVMHPPKQWDIKLLELKKLIENFTLPQLPFLTGSYNSVLLNYYANGSQYMGYHQDNEKSLGPQPTIASLSLGATRKFVIKHIVQQQKIDFHLNHGSLIILGGDFQTEFTHALPQQKKVTQARINLTFRKIVV